MPLTSWSAGRRHTSGRLRLLAAGALVVAAAATGVSPASARAAVATPLLRLTPHAINPVISLSQSATYTVTVANISSDSVWLVGAEGFGDNLGLDSTFGVGCLGSLVAAGNACSYKITFTPLMTGPLSGSFCVSGVTQSSTVADRECGKVRGVAL